MSEIKREKASSIVRILEVVEAISTHESPMSPTDLGVLLDIPKPTAHRLVTTLIEEGFVYTDMRGHLMPADRLHSISLGVMYSRRHTALRQAILKKLSSQIGETCGIAIPSGAEMIYYDKVEANWPLRVHLPVGSKVPAWCSASGKLYLSTLPDARRHAVIKNMVLEKLTKKTITDPALLEQQLQSIKSTGIGLDDEEFIGGMSAVSVPIYSDDGKLFACLFCHAPLTRKSLDELQSYVGLLRSAAEEIADIINSKTSAY
ncbi:IclR family transcriptional regulator [Shewanella nanhaiensis]|uniref:HTH-type transcriptional repressor AllR n=1 Tax=Shewanella nanhaiensis TaxID=2864872 RepID=A0ABS7E5R5_9GAMM|nr:IclR family transcriptional regulator [Shewanella nanhaiensis]MBW8185028.1 IclR family transcriptional regulator [Shewanella nanhaiensis]